MRCTEFLKARVSPEIKIQVKAIADRDLMTEAAWLKRLVAREIRTAEASGSTATEIGRADNVQRLRGAGRKATVGPRPVFVRLRDEDRLLLDARAAARGMRPATYVSVLTRSHLRSLTPLPKEEFLALKRSVGELASIGRIINPIATADKTPGSARDEFRAMLKICNALRENTKALLKANEISWATGHVQADF
jgi:hypothetical protein